MNISGCDADYALVFSEVTGSELAALGNNSASPCVNDALPNFTLTNNQGFDDSIYVALQDTTAGCTTYSIGPGAAASAHKVSLNDACSTGTPKLGQGNFNASLRFS